MSAYEFINNKLNLSSSTLKGLPNKIDQYAVDNTITTGAFGAFSSYDKFKEALIEFINFKNVDTHRSEFMKTDFGVINSILDLKVTSGGKTSPKPKVGAIAVSGDPIDAYLQMIACSCIRFKSEFNGILPAVLKIQLENVKLSNCESQDNSENSDDYTMISQFKNICTYMGGLANFIEQNCLSNQQISLQYQDGYDPFDLTNINKLDGRLGTIKNGAAIRLSYSK